MCIAISKLGKKHNDSLLLYFRITYILKASIPWLFGYAIVIMQYISMQYSENVSVKNIYFRYP